MEGFWGYLKATMQNNVIFTFEMHIAICCKFHFFISEKPNYSLCLEYILHIIFTVTNEVGTIFFYLYDNVIYPR